MGTGGTGGTGGMGTGGQGGTGGVNPCPDGTACDDGLTCTIGDQCQSGMCMGIPSCPAMACQVVAGCDIFLDKCLYQPAMNGASCNDGSACTKVDTCSNGVCVGGSPVVCVPGECESSSVCNPMTGACDTSLKPDGASCSDGSLCSQLDTCQSGVCVGGPAVVCSPPDPCLENGACNPANGQCTFSQKSNGTLCGGGDDCVSGTCSDGVCTGTVQMPGTTCNDSNPCTTADACDGPTCLGTPVDCPLDQCDEAAACNQATGQCQYVQKLDGAPCDDGDACTLIDSCQLGVCSGSSPAVCPDPPPCFGPGVCDSQTGMCMNAQLADGALCGFEPGDCIQGGACFMGVCNAQPELDGVPCPGGICIAGSCFPEPQGSGSGGNGGAGGGSGVGGAGGVQGGGIGEPGSNSDGSARLHGGACGVGGSPGLVGGALGSAAAGIGFAIGLFARRRRKAG
jgi:hypothetical protein